MKKLSLIILALMLSVLFFTNLMAREVVLIGDDAYPPYSYLEDGEAKGIYVDVMKKIFEDIEDYEVKFEMYPWKRCIALIKSGDKIGFFPPYHSEARESWTEFSEPILKEEAIVFAKAEFLKNKKNFPKDFYNFTAGLNDGFNPETMAGKEFASAIKMNLIKIDEAKNNDINLRKLSAGRIDFYINDKMIDISKYPDIKRGLVAKINWGYLGFTKDKMKFDSYYEDLKIKFNESVKNVKKSGEINKIIKKYL